MVIKLILYFANFCRPQIFRHGHSSWRACARPRVLPLSVHAQTRAFTYLPSEIVYNPLELRYQNTNTEYDKSSMPSTKIVIATCLFILLNT